LELTFSFGIVVIFLQDSDFWGEKHIRFVFDTRQRSDRNRY